MKSQPETTIRRIAVLTGYGNSAFDDAFTRPIRRPSRTAAEPVAQLASRWGASPAAERPVIRLEPVPVLAAAEMWRAA